MHKPFEIRNPQAPFHGWLALTGLYLFGLFLLWRFDWLLIIVENDKTLLSVVIIVVFALISAYIGFAARRLNILANEFNAIAAQSGTAPAATTSWLSEHLSVSASGSVASKKHQDAMHDRLVERIHSGHSLGWFTVDTLIRLGLIGTVIGFILMLGAVYQLKDEDVSVLQDLLGSMGVGMQVALYTTLAGISCSLAIALYCKVLDRYADYLVSQIVLYLASAEHEH